MAKRGRPKASKNIAPVPGPKLANEDVFISAPVSAQDYLLIKKESDSWGVPLEALLAAVVRSYVVRQTMTRGKT